MYQFLPIINTKRTYLKFGDRVTKCWLTKTETGPCKHIHDGEIFWKSISFTLRSVQTTWTVAKKNTHWQACDPRFMGRRRDYRFRASLDNRVSSRIFRQRYKRPYWEIERDTRECSSVIVFRRLQASSTLKNHSWKSPDRKQSTGPKMISLSQDFWIFKFTYVK